MEGTLSPAARFDALSLKVTERSGRSCTIPIAASARGRVSEIVHLPAHATIELQAAGGPVEVWQLVATPVRYWRRIWTMWSRVLRRRWGGRRGAAGASLRRAFRDLRGEYHRSELAAAPLPPPSYPEWVQRYDVLTADDCAAIESQLSRWKEPLTFSVFILPGAKGALDATMKALKSQLLQPADIQCLAGPGDLAQVNLRIQKMGPTCWVALLRAGDVIPPHALYWIAHEAGRHHDADLVYADEDELDAEGLRVNPKFKPTWSLALMRSMHAVGAAFAVRASTLAAAGGISGTDLDCDGYDLALRVADRARSAQFARHIPAVLMHRAQRPQMATREQAEITALRAHLSRNGAAATVARVAPGIRHVSHQIPAPPPPVTVIVPTRNALELTRRCIDSLRGITDYPDYEILLVDNRSDDPEALEWMSREEAARRLRILRFDGAFNFSAINNMAVVHARAPLVCLLNNDTEITTAHWLREMVAELLQPRVGVVGAKLLYPDGRVQHAGDILGVGGVANHAHAWLGRNDPGYCGRALAVQEFSAVTAACMLTRRDLYLDMGGLDERHLPVAFNDVDYCLRVREQGMRVVWTPHAELVHHESASRGADRSLFRRVRAKREASYMRRRWAEVLRADPFYNPNLNRLRADFQLGHEPIIHKPWRGT